MPKTKVFISYDYDHDRQLKETLVGQAKLPDSPFSVVDISIQAELQNWQQEARKAIEACDVFVVLLGEYTHEARGVRREAKMAKDLGKTRFQLRKKGHWPRSVDGAGEVVAWKWKNLKKRLSTPS